MLVSSTSWPSIFLWSFARYSIYFGKFRSSNMASGVSLKQAIFLGFSLHRRCGTVICRISNILYVSCCLSLACLIPAPCSTAFPLQGNYSCSSQAKDMEHKLITSLFSSKFSMTRPVAQVNECILYEKEGNRKQADRALITKHREQCKRYAYHATKLTKKLNIQLMMNPPWRTQLENAFSWIGGWRPSTILLLLDAALTRGLVTDETRGIHQNLYNSYFQSVLMDCQNIEVQVEAQLKQCQNTPNPCPAPIQHLFFPQTREEVEEWNNFPTVLALWDGSFERRNAAIKALDMEVTRLHSIVEDAFDLRFQVMDALNKIPLMYQHQVSEFVRLLRAVEMGFRRKGMQFLCLNNNHLSEGQINDARDRERLEKVVQYEQDFKRHSDQQVECARKAKAKEEECEQKTKLDQKQQTQIPDNNKNTQSNNSNCLSTSVNMPGFVNAIASIPIFPMHPSINLQIPNTNNFVFQSSA